MRLARLAYQPSAVVEFFQEGLEALGAVCERTWHDRLHLVAEGPAARLWNETGELIEVQLAFPPPGQSGPRDAAREVFPGSPLTFRLAEALGTGPLSLQRAAVRFGEQQCPAADVAERVWRAQHPPVAHWVLESAFQAAWHFSLLALVRCELQATDQHWFLHRLVLGLPDGRRDENLARDLSFATALPTPAPPVLWPAPAPAQWGAAIHAAVQAELEPDVAAIRQRQENYLRRELDRIDSYFQGYEQELRGRRQRRPGEEAKAKLEQRLAAARHEHERRRQDQLQRHEIRVVTHVDALVCLAERAWFAKFSYLRHNQRTQGEGRLLPRTRQWVA